MTMKVLVLVLSLGAVFARPDVSHLTNNGGYQYRPPTNSYGVPVDNGHGESSHHHHHQQVPIGSYLPANLQVPLTDGHVNFLGGSGSGNDYAFNSHLIQDQKHVYYYAAPDEEEHTRLRIHIAPNNQKNTNVIFVKAPSYGHIIPEVIAPPSQAEDKTKVFVLVKNHEQPGAISIQAPAPVKTKPEVYVVKYNNQHEAELAISGGRGGQPLGSDVHQVGDERSFIQVLEKDSLPHVPHNDKYSGFDGNVNAFTGKAVLYGAPAPGGSNSGNSFALRGNFGGGDSADGSTFSGSTAGGSHGSDFSSVHSESGKGSSFDVGSSGSFGGSSSSGNSHEVRGSTLNGGSIEGSTLFGSTSDGSSGSGGSGISSGSGSSEFSVSGSGKGDGFGSHIGSSLDTLKLGGNSGKTEISISSSSSGSDGSHGSVAPGSFGLGGNFVGGEGSSVSSSFGGPSSDSSKSGGSFSSTYEISGSRNDGKEFTSPVVASLTGGSSGSGPSSSSYEFSSSKTSESGSGSLGARLGDIGDAGSSSSGSFSVKYGPPSGSGPY